MHEEQLPTILIMFGATGDLAHRKLIPALYYLYTRGRLPHMFFVLGFARREISDKDFQSYVASLVQETSGADSDSAQKFSQLFGYSSGNFQDIESYEAIAKRLGKQDDSWNVCTNKLFYLAVPPEYYRGILENLDSSRLTEPCSPEEGWTRVLVEKPFGRDFASAQELDEYIGKLFQEEQVYRVDHYLGKETVQNILAFRFSNSFLSPAWDNRSIERISIQMFEEQGVEDRAGFYDGVGALRDVGQNHLLQLLALMTMKHPGSFEADAIRKERTKVLEALEAMDRRDVATYTVRGQYEEYTNHEKVDPKAETETYFRVETRLNMPQWHGVPIILESGKKMGESRVEITVTFRHHSPCLCPPGKHYRNVLKYQVQPHEHISTSFWVKRPGPDMVIEEKKFSFDYKNEYQGNEFIDAYAKLLDDAIAGDQTLFVSTDEILASWKFIDPIVQEWKEAAVPLHQYTGGTIPTIQPESSLPTKQIGYIGLGKMGMNMSQRLLDYGWDVLATDPNELARKTLAVAGGKALSSASEVVQALSHTRTVWLMVPHQVVDDVLQEILPHLQAGDTIIDGGNSFYKDSIRRAKELEGKGIHYLDIGVSGGPSGARKGACLMIGGEREVYKRYIGLFQDLAVAGGYDYMGSTGSGHFVKMVHNGIEYGMMQAIAEGFAVMKKYSDQFDVERIANLFNHGSVIESNLVGWLKDAYEAYGPQLEKISGSVAHSGEGKWTVEAAKELGIPIPIIEGALQFRIDSDQDPSYTGQIVSALRNQFGGHDVRADVSKK